MGVMGEREREDEEGEERRERMRKVTKNLHLWGDLSVRKCLKNHITSNIRINNNNSSNEVLFTYSSTCISVHVYIYT